MNVNLSFRKSIIAGFRRSRSLWRKRSLGTVSFCGVPENEKADGDSFR